ncbi:uncharacterized protein LOC121869666 [Homarus americanus]|uniref:Uncharacterized protein n=1 Tax=Homarus americanus TaxID=6706 RepID=A0A8J5MWV0_HOMAM|nr:uncharacterized protein LOC121869666 [Homarus americanus]KAG7166282.1 hypothetical protein Hamer_G011111 [Homarus americanus]
MAQESEDNFGVCMKAPLYYFFRNGCVPTLVHLIIQEFRNAQFVRFCLDNPNILQRPEHRCIGSMNMYEFLKIVHQKGKREEQKRKKEEQKKGNDSLNTSRTLHLNNLTNFEVSLRKVCVSDLLETTGYQEAFENLRDVDVTFLLNLLTNDILQYQLDDNILKTISLLKEIRNDIHHPGRSHRYAEMKKQLEVLCENTKLIYVNLKKSPDEIERIKWESLNEFHKRPQILEDLQHEALRRCPAQEHFILPNISHSRGRCQSERVIESLERYILNWKSKEQEETQPFLVCGAPGVGKTTILKNLSNSFCQHPEGSYFSLVLYFDTNCRINNTNNFMKRIFESINEIFKNTVDKYGMDIVEDVIKMYSDKILFIVDWNMTSLGDIMHDIERGTWIITYQGNPEIAEYYQILKVLPLTEQQVDQILRSISDEDRMNRICSLYQDCNYKGLLKSPDMVSIFKEIQSDSCISCDELLHHFINSKVHSTANYEEDLMKLGEIAFKMIAKNGKYYSEDDLCNVSDGVKKPFIEYHKNCPTFKYRVVEDYLAAKYVVARPEVTCIKWLSQVPLFKRVFRFACSLWCDNQQNIDHCLPFIESYLSKYLDIEKPNEKSKKWNKKKKKKKRLRCQNSYGESSPEKPMDVDIDDDVTSTTNCSFVDNVSDCRKRDSFTKWSYLIKLTENCQYHEKVMEKLAQLLLHKQTWQFKCKILDEGKIEKITNVLRHVKEIKSLIVKLESGSNVKILCLVWTMISELKELEGIRVQIMIIQNEWNPVKHRRELMELSHLITRNNTLSITKYIGPFVCSEIPEFFKCLCFRKLEVLDLYVCDIATLREVMSCTNLPHLRDVIVRVNLKSEEQALEDNIKLLVPEFGPFTMIIKYFDNLQKLLDRFESPLNLTSLSIHDVYIHKKFKLDLSRFKNLTCLFVRFVKGTKTAYVLPISPADQEPMEIEDNKETSSAKVSLEQWVFNLSMNLIIPKGLERLLLRNMDFCNNSNSFLLLKYWKTCHIQRLIIEDSSLSLAGVRKILKSHTESLDDKGLEQAMKKIKLEKKISTQVRELLQKTPRLAKEKREERRQNKPDGKELIITSNFDLCKVCKKFPCTCGHQGKGDTREDIEDLIYLIEDTYSYEILSFSFSCNIITVRKDLCGDLRVHCPLSGLKDDSLYNLENDDNMDNLENEAPMPSTRSHVRHLFQTLTLAQCICLSYTDLTYRGAMQVIKILKQGKREYSGQGCVEPFSLTIMSTHHPNSKDEIENSSFLNFLQVEDCLVQFNFCCCCRERCHRINMTRAGRFYVNGEIYNL